MDTKQNTPAPPKTADTTANLRTALIGVGSLGTVIGGMVLDGGSDIDLVDKDPVIVNAIREKGIRITGTKQITVPEVKILFPEEMTPGYDIIFLATKAYDNAEVLPHIASLLKKDGVVVTFQDGFPEKYIGSVVGTNRTMGCTVEWGASLIEPGVSEITSDARFMSVHIGKMEGVSSGQLMNVRNFMEKAGVVHYESDFSRARWSRMLVCCTLCAMNTINGGTFSHVFEGDRKIRRILLESAQECFRVAEAYGGTFAPVQGIDLVKSFRYKSFLKKWWILSSMPRILTNHRKLHSSMQTDVKKGNECEADYTIGTLISYGKEKGVPTPVNEKLISLIHDALEGKIIMTKYNFDNF